MLFMALSTHFAFAQPQYSDLTAGKTFVVAFPDTTKNTFDARYPNTRYVDKTFLMVYSAVDTRVSVRSGAIAFDTSVGAQSFCLIDLTRNPLVSRFVDSDCRVSTNVYTVTAENPVIVYQLLVTRFGAEAWTPLPVEAWGQEYFAAAHPGEIGSDVSPGGEFDYNRRNKKFPGEIMVIAAFDDTRVSITSNATVKDSCATDITLNAGEAYIIQSDVDTLTANVGQPQPDLAGSLITSSRPIGVVTGNTRAQIIDENIGLGKNIFKNMLIESLAPSSLFGTEFVYMPTWDGRRPTGAPTEDPSEKRKAEFVRVYGAGGITTGSYLENGYQIYYDKMFDRGEFIQARHRPNLARVHRTDLPAQAMMTAVGVVKYAGTTNGFGGYIGAAYDGWGGYMVELTPRHRWVSFAPYFAAGHPAGMEFFINVVTDTAHQNDVRLKDGSRFIFERRIAGTDLIWGSMAVQPDITNWLEGRNGALFSGFVYGTLSKGGHEEYRPGRIRDDEGDPPTSVNGGDAAMHPSEYEEYLSIAWAYPLVSTYKLAGAGDSLGIISDSVGCDQVRYVARAVNPQPVGMMTAALEGANNARIARTVPDPLSGATTSEVFVAAIDPTMNASATLVFTDRAGKQSRTSYSYTAETVGLTGPAVDEFPRIRVVDSTSQTLTITNTSTRAIEVRTLAFAVGSIFKVRSASQSLPATLPAGGTLDIIVAAVGSTPRGLAEDVLRIGLDCITIEQHMRVWVTAPCLVAEDVNFFNLQLNETGTRSMRLCNASLDTIVLGSDPSTVITWVGTEFAIASAERQRIAGARIAPSECLTVDVTLNSGVDGKYFTVITVRSNSVGCRDTAFWKGSVGNVSATPGVDYSSRSYITNEPNPFAGITEVRYGIAAAAHTTIVVYNSFGEKVRTLVDAIRLPGDHVVEFDASGLPAGNYHVRISAGEFQQTRMVGVR